MAVSSAIITRRGLIVGGLQMAVAGGLLARMHQLQVDEAENFHLLAEENRINVRLLPPARGAIFDRAGREVAINVPNYRVTIIKEDAGDVKAILERLRLIIALSDYDIDRILEQVDRRSPFVPVTVAENLEWSDFAKVAVNAPLLPGIVTDVGLSRFYPQKSILAHVVGYVGPVSDYDLNRIEDPDPLLQIPRFQIGKFGVEKQMEPKLRGASGSQRIEVNAVGRVMRELDRQNGTPGVPLQLSVDSALQAYCLARMDGLSASAVVMDCETGDLLAVASSPAFDPNLFVRGISVDDYAVLRENKFVPLRAKAVQGTYAPASTFKMITALAALEAGAITPQERIDCTGHVDVSDNRFHCWRPRGHGKIRLQQALMQSCDVYFYTLAQRIGIDAISAMARKFGLGIRYDLPLSAVQRGVVPDGEWKQKFKEEAWLLGDTINASIGQGYVLSSPLQLATMAARLGTGRALAPRLVHRVDTVVQPYADAPDIDVDPKNLRLVQRAMYAASNLPDGTAYRTRVMTKGLQLAGKTGTAQVRRITAEEREAGIIRNADLPWERRDHALFVDYAPYDNPKVAVAVVVEHGGGGSAVAAPIARDITVFALTGKVPALESYAPEYRPIAQRLRQQVLDKLQVYREGAAAIPPDRA